MPREPRALRFSDESYAFPRGAWGAARAAPDDRRDRVEAESTATKSLLSDVRDVDIADAAVRFQQFQTALQANMQTASRVMNLSLLDYLR